MNGVGSSNKSSLASSIGIGKDLVALLRDGAILILAVLLVAFPVQFNSILVNAGFEEGSIVGFKWKKGLVQSNNALQDAQNTISKLQGENDNLLKALNDAKLKLNDPSLLEKFAALEAENMKLKAATTVVQSTVTETIAANAPLVEKVRTPLPSWRKTTTKDSDTARKLELQAYDALVNNDFQLALSLFVGAENASNGFNCVYEWGRLLRNRQDEFGSVEGRRSIIRDSPMKTCSRYIPRDVAEKLSAMSQ
ncbi:hypothetical protein ACLHZT_18585 [Aeromonas veronii]|uniref:hypothetical protein n=1 Tax=Aeromonas veronii TaxID=654 RepID=UPI003BA0A5EB